MSPAVVVEKAAARLEVMRNGSAREKVREVMMGDVGQCEVSLSSGLKLKDKDGGTDDGEDRVAGGDDIRTV